jgi:hypothetical protein
MPVNVANVEDVLAFRALTTDQREACQKLYSSARDFTKAVLELTPVCADQQAAIRLIRDAMKTAESAIAINGAV